MAVPGLRALTRRVAPADPARSDWRRPARVAMLAGLLQFLVALAVLASHPGLVREPDHVACRVWYEAFVRGDGSLSALDYLPQPKPLLAILLGPLELGPPALGPLESGPRESGGVHPAGSWPLAALLAALVGGTVGWVVTTAAGALAGMVAAGALALDPFWIPLIGTTGADLALAAVVGAAAFAWSRDRTALLAVCIALGILVKPVAVALAVPPLLSRAASRRDRVLVLAGVIVGLVGTALFLSRALGAPSDVVRFHRAFSAMIDRPEGTLAWLGHWLGGWMGGRFLGRSWPIALAGIVTGLATAGARGRPFRLWVALTAGLALGYVALAALTGTALTSRFLWPAHPVAIAGAVIAAARLHGRVRRSAAVAAVAAAVARGPGASRVGPALLAPVIAMVLAAGLLVPLLRDLGEARGRVLQGFVTSLERSLAEAAPLIDALAAHVTPGSQVVVPLALQPQVIDRLAGQLPLAAIRSVEMGLTGGDAGEPRGSLALPTSTAGDAVERWVLHQPGGYERSDAAERAAAMARDAAVVARSGDAVVVVSGGAAHSPGGVLASEDGRVAAPGDAGWPAGIWQRYAGDAPRRQP